MGRFLDKWTVKERDSCWSWVTLFSSTLVMSTSFGFLYNFGLFYARFLEEYNESKEKTAWVGSIPMSLMFFMAWMGSLIITRYGLRNSTISASILLGASFLMTSFARDLDQLFFTFSIPFGLAASVLLMSSHISIMTYFDKRLPLAMGLLTGGSGATQVGLTYIYIRLLETYDLKGTLQILAVFTLVICVLAALTFLPTSQSAAVKTEDSGKTQDSRFHKYTAAVKNKRILVFIIAESVDCIAYAVSGVHQVQIGIEMGLPPSICNQFPVFTSISNALGRVFCGFLLDFYVKKKLNYLQGSMFLTGVVALLGLCIKGHGLFVAFICVYGFVDGNLQASVPSALRCLTGMDMLAESFSILLTAASVTVMVGPPVVGLIVDKTHSYTVFFYVAGTPHLLSCGILHLIRYMDAPEINDENEIKQKLTDDNEAVAADIPADQLKHVLRLETPV